MGIRAALFVDIIARSKVAARPQVRSKVAASERRQPKTGVALASR